MATPNAFSLSHQQSHEAISAMPEEVFEAMMALVMAEDDPNGVMLGLGRGHIPAKYAPFFGIAVPLPVVVDPYVYLTEGDLFLDLVGIEADNAARMSRDYQEHPATATAQVIASVSASVEEATGVEESKLVFDASTLGEPSREPQPYRIAEAGPRGDAALSPPRHSPPEIPVPVFDLLPDGPHRYAAIVTGDCVVTGGTPREAKHYAYGYAGIGPHPVPPDFRIGKLGGDRTTLHFGNARVPPDIPPPLGGVVADAEYRKFVKMSSLVRLMRRQLAELGPGYQPAGG
jgi:hypothetical protein